MATSERQPQKQSEWIANFDLDKPKLDKTIEKLALKSGGYPYDKTLKREKYENELELLQIELLKLQAHIRESGERVVCLFEGRDAAGKGGTIGRIMEHLRPRYARAIALQAPTDTEKGLWYFQRYVPYLPTRGNMTLFDRSWYNRAGVERVMGFCTREELADFLREAPRFEEMLVRDGIRLFKFYLLIGREMQLLRFHERRHHPLKQWKISDIDLAAIRKWDDYTLAQTDMFQFTHTTAAPWVAIHANDQRRARLEAIRHLLLSFDYEGKDKAAVGEADPNIIGSGSEYFEQK